LIKEVKKEGNSKRERKEEERKSHLTSDLLHLIEIPGPKKKPIRRWGPAKEEEEKRKNKTEEKEEEAPRTFDVIIRV